MRIFTEQENEWITELVETKQKGRIAIRDLQVAKLLREKFEFFALKWTYGSKPQVSLYHRCGESKAEIAKTERLYLDICDYIYFIKELETLGFIAIQHFSLEEENREFSILYDRTKYTYKEDTDEFEPKEYEDLRDMINCQSNKKIPLEKIDDNMWIPFQINRIQNINLDFANDLHKYGEGIIYPLPLAKDYVENDFKTLEERKHKEEMDIALKSARLSQKSFIIAFISLIFSVGFGAYQRYSSQKIDSEQFNIIKNAIYNNQIKDPLEIKDPLNVKIKDAICTKPIGINRGNIPIKQNEETVKLTPNSSIKKQD